MDYRDAETTSRLDGVLATYYDCSSFVWYCLKNGGFDVVGANGGNSWPFTTENMVGVLTRLGFIELPIESEWIAGDIVMYHVSNEEGHTEMVWGANHVCMGAHGRNIRGGGTVPLANQVSIGTKYADYAPTDSHFKRLFRYGNGVLPNYEWVYRRTNQYLTQSEMTNNAHCVAGYFLAKGWTANAIAGMLGNMQRECTLNPAFLEEYLPFPFDGLGTGLVQWTPAEDRYHDPNPLRLVFNALGYNYDNDWVDGNKQCDALYAEYQEYAGEQHRGIEKQWYENFPSVPSQFSMKWTDYIHSYEDVGYLATVFVYCYERAGVVALEERVANARRWYEVIKNDSPYLPPQVSTDKKHGMPVWMMIRRYR